MHTTTFESLSDLELSKTTGGAAEDYRPGALMQSAARGIGNMFSSAWNSLPGAPQGVKDGAADVGRGAAKQFMGPAAGAAGF